MSTIAESISRIRSSVKGVKEDSFLTDRNIYSLISKYGKTLMKRQDNMNKLLGLNSIFITLPCIELIEVDKIEACCAGIKSGCTIMRSKEKIPGVMEGRNGPLFRSITSIDGSIEVYNTKPSIYTSFTKTSRFKYNKSKYYWYMNDYLYFPNLEWESIRVEGIFEGDTSGFTCDADDTSCKLRQNQSSPYPDYLFSEIENMIKQDLSFTAQLPAEEPHDKKNILR